MLVYQIPITGVDAKGGWTPLNLSSLVGRVQAGDLVTSAVILTNTGSFPPAGSDALPYFASAVVSEATAPTNILLFVDGADFSGAQILITFQRNH